MNAPRPELTVVIPCHNALAWLPLQLDALMHQENAPSAEILLCDNRSSDGLPAWIAEHRDRYPSLRLVPAHELRGAAYARNRGIGEARAEKIAFCDADDVVAADWMRRAVDALEDHPLLSGGIAMEFDDDFPATAEGAQQLIEERRLDEPVRRISRGSVAPALMGCNFAARRDFLVRIGGMDAASSGRAEDNELALRLERSGALLYEDPTMMILYRVRRARSRQNMKKLFVDAYSVAELCAAYDAWSEAETHRRWPGTDLARALGAGLLMASGRKPRDFPAVLERLLVSAGALAGEIRYRYPRRKPQQLIGAGLKGPARSGPAASNPAASGSGALPQG